MDQRRVSYKAPPRLGQAHRRQEALAAQRERRSDALAAVRGLDDLEGLQFDDSGSSEGEDARFEDAPSSTKPAPFGAPQFEISADHQAGPSSAAEKKAKKIQRISRKYRRYADRCMYAEELELTEPGVMDDLEEQCIAVGPVPEGKRCLVLTHTLNATTKNRGAKPTNTILLSRVSAKPLGRFLTVLPADCILDCIYAGHSATASEMTEVDGDPPVLWVLDILQWKSQRYVDCEAEFRFFWRAAKFGELPAQEWPPREPPHLLVVPIPASPASIATLASTAELLLRNPRTSLPLSTLARVEATGAKVPVSGDGILLYLKSATYEAGETVLAGWIPLHAEADEESAVSVLLRRCHEVQTRVQQ